MITECNALLNGQVVFFVEAMVMVKVMDKVMVIVMVKMGMKMQ